MLPTTGHFKSIICPFYDTCICERPYCHFKHAKQNISDADILSELVSKAVHKVLTGSIHSSSESVEKSCDQGKHNFKKSSHVTYNPTPISELNKYKSNNLQTENSEKRNRHIPIQYTPEQPRSFRSFNSSYSTLEYNIDESKNSVGYSPSTSVSYIPSSIKTLTDNPSLSDCSSDNITQNKNATEANVHQYVPFHLDTTQINAYKAEYNPTKNLSSDTNPSFNEYIPKHNDEFIDDFIYEPSDILRNTSNIVDIKEDESNETKSDVKSDSNLSNTNLKCDKTKSKSSSKHSSSSHRSVDEEDRLRVKDKTKERDKKCHKSDHSHSSNSLYHSSSKSRHKNEKKERTKHTVEVQEVNGYKDKKSTNHKKHKRHQSRSCDRQRKIVQSSSREKREKTSVNSNKFTDIQEDELNHRNTTDNPRRSPIDYCNLNYFSDDSEDETLEQCKRIFEEYQPPVQNVQVKKLSTIVETETSITATSSKRRVAHEKSSSVFRKQIVKPIVRKSAAEIMAERYKKILSNIKEKGQIPSSESLDIQSFSTQTQKRHAGCKVEKSTDDTGQETSYPNPAKIKRIAHVPNVNSLLSAKKQVEEIVKTKPVPKTVMQTVTKGNKHVAQVPQIDILDIPTVLQSERSKLPVNVRMKYLVLMVNECIKLYVSKQAAYERALNEELNCYSKCSAISTYRNSVMLSINRIRKETEAVSGPSNGVNVSDFTGNKFYENIYKWILSEEQLLENGYPRPGATKKGFALFKQDKMLEKVPDNSQLCVRCQKIYAIDDDGFQKYPGDCIYHPCKRFTFRGETKFLCCKESTASTGCCSSPSHVFKIRNLADLSGFVTTFEAENSDDPKNFAVYALDCEMVYTTRGFELARITVVDNNCDVAYESLVKPVGHIIDYNTRFSGLTKNMFENITTKITDVQATLLLMFNSRTILVGHSLESDLTVLRLIHSTVIDTSVLFPHKMGPPRKRGLKGLASDYLKKIIQDSDAGHDSAEDANACMELIIWKLKEEIKLR